MNWLTKIGSWLLNTVARTKDGKLRDGLIAWWAFVLSAHILDGIQGGSTVNLTKVLSDNMNAVGWTDALLLGYSLIIAESINNWAEVGPTVAGSTLVMGIVEVLSDDGHTNWADFTPTESFQYQLQLGCPHMGNNWLEADLLGYGLAIPDTIVLSDGLVVGYQLNLSDTLVAMSDSIRIGYGLGTNETLVLSDAVGAQYGIAISDTLSMSDVVIVQPIIPIIAMDALHVVDAAIAQGFVSDSSGTKIDLTSALSSGSLLPVRNAYEQRATADYEAIAQPQYASSFWSEAVTTNLATASTGAYGLSLQDAMWFVDVGAAGVGALAAPVDSVSFFYNVNRKPIHFPPDDFAVQLIAPLSLALSDTMVLSDSIAIGYGISFNETLTLSDKAGAQYGIVLSDTLSMSNALAAGYGLASGETLVFTDTGAVGYGLVFSDNLNNWTDSVPALVAQWQIDLGCPHLGQNWADAVSAVASIALALSDTLVLSDSLAIGYGLSKNETLTLSDTIGAQYGLVLSDSFALTDSVLIGYGVAENETLVLSDSLTAGYGITLSDSFTLTDSVILVFQLNISVNETVTISDSRLVGYGFAIVDNEVMSDSDGVIENYLVQLSDTLSMSDTLAVGYGFVITENANNLADSVSLTLSYLLLLTDAFPGLADTEAAILGELISFSDTLSQSDSLAAGFGLGIGETLVLTDTNGAGYGLVISDNLNNWLDAVAVALIGNQIQLQLSDTMTLSDSLAIGYGLASGETLTISDAVGAQYGLVVSDVLSLSDSAGIGYGLVIPESMVIADVFSALFAYLFQTQDQQTMVDLLVPVESFEVKIAENIPGALDALALVLNAQLAFADNLNQWQEFISLLETMNLAVQDVDLAWLDQLTAQMVQLLQLSDVLTLSESYLQMLISAAVLVLSDSEGAAWLDSVVEALASGIPRSIGLVSILVKPVVQMRTLQIVESVGLVNVVVEEDVNMSTVEVLA